MHRILFIEEEPDWIQFANAFHMKSTASASKIEWVWSATLGDIGPNDIIFLIGHGTSKRAGDFESAKTLADLLKAQGLKSNHRFIRLETCSAAAQTSNGAECIAQRLKHRLEKHCPQLTVIGGTGATVTGSQYDDQVVNPEFMEEVRTTQRNLINSERHSASIMEAKGLAATATKQSTPDELTAIAKKVYTLVTPFFRDFGDYLSGKNISETNLFLPQKQAWSSF